MLIDIFPAAFERKTWTSLSHWVTGIPPAHWGRDRANNLKLLCNEWNLKTNFPTKPITSYQCRAKATLCVFLENVLLCEWGSWGDWQITCKWLQCLWYPVSKHTCIDHVLPCPPHHHTLLSPRLDLSLTKFPATPHPAACQLPSPLCYRNGLAWLPPIRFQITSLMLCWWVGGGIS